MQANTSVYEVTMTKGKGKHGKSDFRGYDESLYYGYGYGKGKPSHGKGKAHFRGGGDFSGYDYDAGKGKGFLLKVLVIMENLGVLQKQ